MKIVQLPRKLWVGSYEFSLRTVPITDDNLKTEGAGIASDGMCNTDEGARGIWIADNLDARHRLEIVLHEIVHAINWATGITDEMPVEEEDVADKHGAEWARFYLDNPRFAPWLMYVLERIKQEQNEDEDTPVNTEEAYANPQSA